MPRGINYESLGRQFRAASRSKTGLKEFYGDIAEGLEKGHIKPADVSIRQLFEAVVPGGRELVDSWNPKHGGGIETTEAAAVNTSAFSNITGQIVYTTMLEAFDSAELIGNRLFKIVPTSFNGEKIPGIGATGDQFESIGEGMPYPLAGLTEEYIETPETVKRGLIVPVTKEAVFFDRTSLVLQRAGDIGMYLAMNREKRMLDCAFGITNTFKRNGTTNNTYLTSGLYINSKTSNALADWTDIENAELLFDAMVDLNTSEPVMVTPKQLVVPTALKHTARYVVSATQVRIGDTTAASAVQTVANNPLDNYEIVTSSYVKSRTSSATTWFIGDFQRAFWYMENWPLTVQKAPANAEAEWSRDIVAQFKASERGTPAVMYPQAVVKSAA